MSLYRPKGSKIWVMDFKFHGQRIRESTGTASKSRACRIEQKRRYELAEGAAGSCPNCDSGILVDREKPETGYSCADCNFEVDELPAGLVGVRFHDLRHTAVSRMIAARIPLPIIAKIVGWSAATLAKMSARYGHFALDELRTAVEAISAPAPLRDAGYPQFSSQSDAHNGRQRAN